MSQRWTSCCEAACSWTSTASCGRAFALRWRATPSSGWSRSTASNGEIDLRDAGESIVEFENWLEPEDGTDRDDLLEKIRAYNRDDCLSTCYLREWLEDQRAALVNEVGAEAPPRPTVKPPEETEDTEAQREVQELVAQLTADLPEDLTDGRSLEDASQRGRWLLAQLLDWHRREDKAFWWRYFHLKDELTDEERVGETDALGRPQLRGQSGRSQAQVAFHDLQLSVPVTGPQDRSRRPATRSAWEFDRRSGLHRRSRRRDRPEGWVQPGSTGADITDRLRICRSRAKTAEPSKSGDVGDRTRDRRSRAVPGGTRPVDALSATGWTDRRSTAGG